VNIFLDPALVVGFSYVGYWPTASGRPEAERVTAILRIAARQYLDGWQAVDDPKRSAPGKAGKG
jgi:hypothetical protein